MTTQELVRIIKQGGWTFEETDTYIDVPGLFKVWKKEHKLQWHDLEYMEKNETESELLHAVRMYHVTPIAYREILKLNESKTYNIHNFFEDTPLETQDEWLENSGLKYKLVEPPHELEQLRLIHDICVDYDNCKSVECLKKLVDEIKEIAKSKPTNDDTRYFKTGARRDSDKGKPKFTYLPFDVLDRVAKHYEEGAKKYGDHNWRMGIPSTTILDSLLRHVVAYYKGLNDEDHLSAIVFNALCLIYNEDKMTDNEDVFDMPKWWKDRGFR